MPSLQIDNKNLYSILDHYRHYLPQELHYNHDTLEQVLNIKNTQTFRSQQLSNKNELLLYFKYISTLLISSISINIYPWILSFMKINYNNLIIFTIDEFYVFIEALFVLIFCKSFIPKNKYYKRLSFIIWFILNIFTPTIINAALHYNLHIHHNDKYYVDMKYLFIAFINPSFMFFITIITIYVSTQFICNKYLSKSQNSYKLLISKPVDDSYYNLSSNITNTNFEKRKLTTELVNYDNNKSDQTSTNKNVLTISTDSMRIHRNTYHTKSTKSLSYLSNNEPNINDKPSSPSRSSDMRSSYSFSISQSTMPDHSINESNTFNHKVPNNSNPLKHEQFVFYQFMFFFVWMILWLLIYITFYILPNSDYKFSYWEHYYFFILFITSILKWLIKKMARHLDSCQITASKLRLLFSLEYYFEFYCSAVYWIAFRMIISYYVDSNMMFCAILAAHLCTEFLQSSVKLTKIYFKHTELWQLSLQKTYDTTCKIIINWFYVYIFKDNSNIYQWRIRCGLDIMARFNVALITAIFQIMLNLIIDADIMHIVKGNRGNVYNGIAFVIEMFYYIFGVFLISYLMYGNNIFDGFCSLILWKNEHTKYMIFSRTIVISVLYMFGFLGFLLNY